jgi:aspartate racemase
VAAAGGGTDRDFPRILVDMNPAVPDRNRAAAGLGPSPGPALAAMAAGLAGRGAEVLAMPCNAAHGWSAELCAGAPAARFVDMVAATVGAVATARHARVGLIAVAATRALGLYRGPLHARGIETIEAPDAMVAPVVAAVKAGDRGPGVRAAAAALARQLVLEGADAVIAACTEIPLVLGPGVSPVPLVDPTAILAGATLAAARLSEDGPGGG